MARSRRTTEAYISLWKRTWAPGGGGAERGKARERRCEVQGEGHGERAGSFRARCARGATHAHAFAARKHAHVCGVAVLGGAGAFSTT